jgi:transposase
LEPAAAGAAGGRAQRGGDRHLGEAGLAADKKSARRRGAWIVFQDESGFSLLPPVRATWAPRGHTPVLRHRFSWTRLSMSGALAYKPDSSEAALVFQITEGSYNTDSLICFLTDLHDHFRAEKITLIWDGLPSHRSRQMKAWIATQRHWLLVEQLPGYAHDLNPIEMVWGNIKNVELANLCPDTIDQAHHAAQAGLQRVGSSYDLCCAFLAHTGLSL